MAMPMTPTTADAAAVDEIHAIEREIAHLRDVMLNSDLLT